MNIPIKITGNKTFDILLNIGIGYGLYEFLRPKKWLYSAVEQFSPSVRLNWLGYPVADKSEFRKFFHKLDRIGFIVRKMKDPVYHVDGYLINDGSGNYYHIDEDLMASHVYISDKKFDSLPV